MAARLFASRAAELMAGLDALWKQAPKGTEQPVVINADALGVPDASAREGLDKARRELGASGIQIVFGNVRAPLRAALSEIGSFTLIDEDEFMADVRKVRGATT